MVDVDAIDVSLNMLSASTIDILPMTRYVMNIADVVLDLFSIIFLFIIFGGGRFIFPQDSRVLYIDWYRGRL